MSRPMAGTPTRRPHRQFTDAFKAGAVRLVLDEGKTVRAAARDLDLTETALREWVPIESAWALLKKRIRAFAPRTVSALRQVARAARHVIQPHHCRQWFQHCGYANSSTIRG